MIEGASEDRVSGSKLMVYIVGLAGLLLGFAAGQLLLLMLLRNRSNKEILTDRGIKWTYGLLNWIVAGAGAYAAVLLYGIFY